MYQHDRFIEELNYGIGAVTVLIVHASMTSISALATMGMWIPPAHAHPNPRHAFFTVYARHSLVWMRRDPPGPHPDLLPFIMENFDCIRFVTAGISETRDTR